MNGKILGYSMLFTVGKILGYSIFKGLLRCHFALHRSLHTVFYEYVMA